jgi:protein-tyrosine phosphatase
MAPPTHDYIDIHCHWLAGVDDGAPSIEEGLALLGGLHQLGFGTVYATPHMRAGLFDNDRDGLRSAYQTMKAAVERAAGMPRIELACEHHLDDTVFARLLAGQGLPYPSGRAALVELPSDRFPLRLGERMFELRCRRMRPVLAHPERYRPVWRNRAVLDPLLDGGVVTVLDLGSLAGKYGRAVRRSAEELLEDGYYYAASSDAHRAEDVETVAAGIRRLVELAGQEEATFMLAEGPQAILDGNVED